MFLTKQSFFTQITFWPGTIIERFRVVLILNTGLLIKRNNIMQSRQRLMVFSMPNLLLCSLQILLTNWYGSLNTSPIIIWDSYSHLNEFRRIFFSVPRRNTIFMLLYAQRTKVLLYCTHFFIIIESIWHY